MDHIVEVMDAALTKYTLYSLSGQWMASLTHHANKMSTPPPGFKCDNCGDPHFMNQCPKYFDDERITHNWKARGAPPRNRRGGGDGGNGGRGSGGGCGRGGGRGHGGNYGQGNFIPPAKKETVNVVNGKTYTACKDYGWNSGDRVHTSGGHEISSMIRYSITFALKTKTNNLLGAADGDIGGDCTNDSGGGNGVMNSLTAIMMDIFFII